MLSALLLVSCDQDHPIETQPTVTAADTEAPAENVTEPATIPAETEPETAVAETQPSETTEAVEETTVFELPVLNPDEAAAAGLPTDANSYTVGGETPASDPKAQFDYLKVYAHAYADKTFVLYGNIGEDDHGNMTLSVGEGMTFVVYFDGVAEPVVGSYVKVTAAFTRTVDRGEYVDFGCFTMMATACEVLGEAKGPNGGRLMYVTASSLNVRSEPDSSKDNKVGLLYSGDMVEVLETGLGSNKNWCKITFDCDAGYAYISMTYVSETKP
jgi:hypothetical protein